MPETLPIELEVSACEHAGDPVPNSQPQAMNVPQVRLNVAQGFEEEKKP